MAITIRGIRINNINLVRKEEGQDEIKGEYELISSTDKVLAKQTFNGYSDCKVAWSPQTLAALQTLNQRIKADLEMTLGLDPNESTLNDMAFANGNPVS